MVGIRSHKEKAYEMYEVNTFKNLPSEEKSKNINYSSVNIPLIGVHVI